MSATNGMNMEIICPDSWADLIASSWRGHAKTWVQYDPADQTLFIYSDCDDGEPEQVWNGEQTRWEVSIECPTDSPRLLMQAIAEKIEASGDDYVDAVENLISSAQESNCYCFATPADWLSSACKCDISNLGVEAGMSDDEILTLANAIASTPLWEMYGEAEGCFYHDNDDGVVEELVQLMREWRDKMESSEED